MRRAMVVGRRGPGLLGTVARTAVVAGTATAVSRGVSNTMDQRAAAQQAEAQQQQQAIYNAGFQQAQQDALARQQQPTGAGAMTDDTIAQLQRLGELQKQGILTSEEFAQQKARILGA